MHTGTLSWVSPKGYAWVKLEGGEDAFVPAHIIANYKEEELENKRVRVGVTQGNRGKIVTYLHLDAEPLFSSLA